MEDVVGPPSNSFSSSSSGCGRSVRVQMGVVPKRPAYNLNWIFILESGIYDILITYLIPEIHQLCMCRWPNATCTKIGGCLMNTGNT